MGSFNPQYDTIGKSFAQQYYAMFDNPASRGDLLRLYHVSNVIINMN